MDASWEKLQDRLIKNRRSKYEQGEQPFTAPGRPFVFLPLQVLNDVVAQLAYIPHRVLMERLAEWLPELGFDLVVKRHPKCDSHEMATVLRSLGARRKVLLTNASIHDVIPGATAVITVNSGVGFESLLYGKRVILAGQADYALATTVVRSEVELRGALADLGKPIDIEYIQRFMHYYVTEYLIEGGNKAAMTKRVRAIVAPLSERLESAA